MQSMIKGITVTLFKRTQNGVDDLNVPVFKTTPVDVENVVVSPASSTEVLSTTDLEGKKDVYLLCIPKGDTNDWENQTVYFFGAYRKTFGYCKQYIDSNVPLDWNKQIYCARSE